MLQKPESGGLPILQAEGEMDGGHDSARALAAKTLARRRACLRLDQTVTELVQFLLVKDRKKSPITLSEMVKYIIRDLKDLFPEIIARPAEHLRYLKQLDRKHHTYILISKLKPGGGGGGSGRRWPQTESFNDDLGLYLHESDLETSKMKVLGFVARLHKKEPQHWPVQYRKALADEADRD
ncbi:hypothetical protein E2I00_002974, partial [Balaenoptera physalus]